ncbi:MAG: hypothetical protein A2X48_12775 [Lentisphaerae bacterium GWF2_49_21]|nr:MAG: hypothetical protein A2X48_12775 [Lentisphaerae bacterium GWF2_49_21]
MKIQMMMICAMTTFLFCTWDAGAATYELQDGAVSTYICGPGDYNITFEEGESSGIYIYDKSGATGGGWQPWCIATVGLHQTISVTISDALQMHASYSHYAKITVTPITGIAPPVISPGGGSITVHDPITMSCPGASETRYTLDGSDPTASSSLYTGAFLLNTGNYVLKARGYNLYLYSKVSSKTFTVFPGRCATPEISPAGGLVKAGTKTMVSCMTPGATIYYTTDGSEPSETSMTYTEPLTVNRNLILKAFAKAAGLADSETAVQTFIINLMPPKIFPPGGSFMSGDEVDAVIANSPDNNGEGTIQFRYNYGGIQSAWTNYTNPIIITETSTLEAKVVGPDGESDIASATYTFTMERVEAPSITPQGGYFETAPPEISISCATPGATIYCSINRDVTKSAASIYTGAFSLPVNSNPGTAWDILQPDTSGGFSTSFRVYAMAAKSGMADSATVSRVYVLGGGLPPAQPQSNDGGVTIDDSGSFTGSDGQTYTIPDYTDYLNHRNDLVDDYNNADTPEEQEGIADQIHDLDDDYYNDVNNYYYEYNTIVNPPENNDNSGGETDTGTDTTTDTSSSTTSMTTSVISTAAQSNDTGNGNLLFLGGAAAGTALLPSLLDSGEGKAFPPEDSSNEPESDSYARKVYFTK